MSAVSTGLHWYRFTSQRPWEDLADLVSGKWAEPQWRGGFNQPQSVTHESGARLFFGSDDPQQPCVVECSGEVCERFSDEAVTWSNVAAASVARYDVALDLEPAELARQRMIEMRRAWKSGKVATRMQSFSEHRSDDGWTWYFGSRSSTLFGRVYDVRGPLRIEFEAKPDKSIRSSIPALLRSNPMPSVWRGMAKELVFPCAWYRSLLVGDTASWEPATSQDNDLVKVLDQLRLQYGQTFWALMTLGVDLHDLAKAPEMLAGDLARKLSRWADEGEVLGYDGEKLRQEVQCRLKSKPGSRSLATARRS